MHGAGTPACWEKSKALPEWDRSGQGKKPDSKRQRGGNSETWMNPGELDADVAPARPGAPRRSTRRPAGATEGGGRSGEETERVELSLTLSFPSGADCFKLWTTNRIYSLSPRFHFLAARTKSRLGLRVTWKVLVNSVAVKSSPNGWNAFVRSDWRSRR